MQAVALYDYPPSGRANQRMSADLSFQQGELVRVLDSDGDAQFVTVLANGTQGRVLRSYVDISNGNDPLTPLQLDADLSSPVSTSSNKEFPCAGLFLFC